MPSLPHDLSSDFDADVQRWRDLYLRSDRLDADTLRDRLIGAIRPPWHDPRLGDQDESELWTWFRLEREADGTVPHAQIVLHKVDGGLKLTNVVSGGSGGEFDRATYNRVVVDFHDRLVLALDKDDDVSLSLSAASASFADWVGEEAVEILARFSVTASRSSAMGYPGSEERWLHFLYLAVQHADAGFVDALRQVLVNNGWPDDAADELASQAELVEAYERLGRERYRRTA